MSFLIDKIKNFPQKPFTKLALATALISILVTGFRAANTIKISSQTSQQATKFLPNLDSPQFDRFARQTQLRWQNISDLNQQNLDVNTLHSAYFVPENTDATGVDFIGFVLWHFGKNNQQEAIAALQNFNNHPRANLVADQNSNQKLTLPNTGFKKEFLDGGDQISHVLSVLQLNSDNKKTLATVYEFCEEGVSFVQNPTFKNGLDFLVNCGKMNNEIGENTQDLQLNFAISRALHSQDVGITFVYLLHSDSELA